MKVHVKALNEPPKGLTEADKIEMVSGLLALLFPDPIEQHAAAFIIARDAVESMDSPEQFLAELSSHLDPFVEKVMAQRSADDDDGGDDQKVKIHMPLPGGKIPSC